MGGGGLQQATWTPCGSFPHPTPLATLREKCPELLGTTDVQHLVIQNPVSCVRTKVHILGMTESETYKRRQGSGRRREAVDCSCEQWDRPHKTTFPPPLLSWGKTQGPKRYSRP